MDDSPRLKQDLEVGMGVKTQAHGAEDGPGTVEGEGDSEHGLNYLMKPIAHINETKDILHKLGTVTVIRKLMVFSDSEFETRFIDSLEPKLRARMLLFGLATSIYGIYNMFFVCLFHRHYTLNLVQFFRTRQQGS
jgi:hypothetical protein